MLKVITFQNNINLVGLFFDPRNLPQLTVSSVFNNKLSAITYAGRLNVRNQWQLQADCCCYQAPVRTHNHKEHNITFFLWTHWKAGQISDDQLLSSLIFPHCLLYFIFCFFSPSPCNFFVQRIKFHLRGLWERRPSDWPLPVQMLWIYGAFLPARRSREGWRDGW